jgi:hypothetical protein
MRNFFLLIIPLVVGCSPKLTGILPEGQIIDRDGDMILTLWKDVAGKPNVYRYEWVYMEGLQKVDLTGYQVRIIIQKEKNP